MAIKRTLAVVAACAGVALLAWIVLIGAVYAWGGVAMVRVQDPAAGVDLFVPVPLALVDAVLTTTAWMVPEDHWVGLEGEFGDWGPAMRGLLEELDRCPDVTLVEVSADGEHVKVYKQDGMLKVEVDEDELSIRVSVPTRAVSKALGKLSRRV